MDGKDHGSMKESCLQENGEQKEGTGKFRTVGRRRRTKCNYTYV